MEDPSKACQSLTNWETAKEDLSQKISPKPEKNPEEQFYPYLKKILLEVKSYLPSCNTELIEKAYSLGARLHANQYRKSGEPYFIHPLEVAYILAKMKLDIPTIVAGLLHDIVEDTDITLEDIEKLFGKEIAFIVDGVTKLKHLPKAGDKSYKQAENLRKILLAMSKDLRVIFVKLADRLHNMRTLEFLPEEKQKRIARETLDIYAPLAARLGIDWLKCELEDLCFKYLYPFEYEILKKKVEERIKASEEYVKKVKEVLKFLLDQHKIKGRVLGRIKHLFSIYRKLQKYNLTINDIEYIHDIIGFRIIVQTVEECYKTLGIVHSKWPPVPGRFKDYISLPKPNMYQSLHTTVIGPEGKKVEIQIRTEYMDKIANEGIAAHFLYKEGKNLTCPDDKQFSWLKKLIELQKELRHPREFLESLKLDLFPEEIYVFTPKGDVIMLPAGATPLDFAYAIHTEVGHHCVRAFVNDRLVPLDYQLQTGDIVRIETSSSQKPRRDWLKIVKTGRARSRIKQFLKREEKKRFVELGKELLKQAVSKISVSYSEIMDSKWTEQILTKLNLKDPEELLYLIGKKDVTPFQVIKTYEELTGEKLLKEEKEARRERKRGGAKGPSRELIIIDGERDILFHLAKCCNPIPGDEVIGYITRGKGVSIHRVDCPNLKHCDPERLIDVKWSKPDGKNYIVRLYIVALDRKGLLASLSSAISEAESNILKANLKTSIDKAFLDVIIEVTDNTHLSKVISNITKVEGILKVERALA